MQQTPSSSYPVNFHTFMIAYWHLVDSCSE